MRRVLVVDDEENIRVVLRTLLKKHNYEVEAAESAETALEQLERFDPDSASSFAPSSKHARRWRR